MEDLSHLKSNFERAQYLQEILIAHATGGSGENNHYIYLRSLFLKNPTTKSLVPDWIRTHRTLGQFWPYIKSKFNTYAERRNYIWEEFAPLLDFLETNNIPPSENYISETLEKFDKEGINAIWQKALERRSQDPEGAITISRTMLESVCKYILDDLSVDYDSKRIELSDLYKKTAKQLNLSPEQHTEKVFKQILGGCSGIVNGLGSLRNQLGDAHGKGKRRIKPASRHAELAVNLAGTMSLFLISTYEARNQISDYENPDY